MSLALCPVVGTIRIEPVPMAAAEQPEWNDSTLALLLESFVRCDEMTVEAPAASGRPICVVARARLSRFALAKANHVPIRANLAQLRDDLEAEYEQLGAV